MYRLEYTTNFKKDLKTCKKRGLELHLSECHIKSDWLLIWQQNDTELVLIMTDTGTHADLY